MVLLQFILAVHSFKYRNKFASGVACNYLVGY